MTQTERIEIIRGLDVTKRIPVELGNLSDDEQNLLNKISIDFYRNNESKLVKKYKNEKDTRKKTFGFMGFNIK